MGKAKIDYQAKFQKILELGELMEQAVIFKLKKKNPNISEDEIKIELQKWYKHRPEAPYGDAEGEVGDVSRFLK